MLAFPPTGIDRILGVFRIEVNVTGDLTACAVFNKFYNIIPDKVNVQN